MDEDTLERLLIGITEVVGLVLAGFSQTAVDSKLRDYGIHDTESGSNCRLVASVF